MRFLTTAFTATFGATYAALVAILPIVCIAGAVYMRMRYINPVARPNRNDVAARPVQVNYDISKGPVAVANYHFNPQAEYRSFVTSSVDTFKAELAQAAGCSPMAAESAIRTACEENQAAIVWALSEQHAAVIATAKAQGLSHVTQQLVKDSVSEYLSAGKSDELWVAISNSINKAVSE